MSPEDAASELRNELAEETALRDKLADILTRAAVALRGPEPEGTRWDWSGIPERIAALKAELEAVRLCFADASHSASATLVHVEALKEEVAALRADEALLDFQEKFKGQVWHDRLSGTWTFFARVANNRIPIQPTKRTLREVLGAAMHDAEKDEPLP